MSFLTVREVEFTIEEPGCTGMCSQLYYKYPKASETPGVSIGNKICFVVKMFQFNCYTYFMFLFLLGFSSHILSLTGGLVCQRIING